MPKKKKIFNRRVVGTGNNCTRDHRNVVISSVLSLNRAQHGLTELCLQGFKASL